MRFKSKKGGAPARAVAAESADKRNAPNAPPENLKETDISSVTGGCKQPAITGWNLPGIDFPSFHLILLAKAIERLSVRLMADEGELSMAEWRVLSRLAPGEEATVREIALNAWVDRAEVSRAAASLEKAGFTARRENPQDRRSPILFATDAGRDLYLRLLPIRADFHRELSCDLEPAERAMLDHLLLKVAHKVTGLTSGLGK